MPAATLRLKRGRDRARVHPWIFKGDVADVADVAPGSDVRSWTRRAASSAGASTTRARALLPHRHAARRPLDGAFLAARLHDAIARRRSDGAPPDAVRLVWSEADGLPGLVVDRYGAVVAVQCLTLGDGASAARRSPTALCELLGDVPIFSADDAAPAALEGFEAAPRMARPPGPRRA